MSSNHKLCRFCYEPVDKLATRCPHCTSELPFYDIFNNNRIFNNIVLVIWCFLIVAFILFAISH